MKKLVMSALMLGVLSQAAGCIFVTDDDGETAAMDVGWVLEDGSCGGPVNTATINALLDGDSTPYKDIYDCADGSGITQDLPLGHYTVWVDLTDGSGGQLMAQSESFETDLVTQDQLVVADFTINVTNGFFDVGWTFAGGDTCADAVGEDGISVLSTEVGNPSGAFDDLFDCEDGFGVTFPIPVGEYTISTAIINANGEALGDAPPVTEVIDHGNEFVTVDVVITLF
jgi:hypothetical protein